MTSIGVIEKIVVFDEGLYHGNGLVGKWVNLITDRFAREAKRYAPVRSGVLRAGIFGEAHQVGVRQVQGIIWTTAPYSLFVLGGTTGPIMANRAWASAGQGAFETRTIYRVGSKWSFQPSPGAEASQIRVAQKGFFMPIPAHGTHRAFFALAVGGQRANNFMLKAWAATARDHRAIRGVSVPQALRIQR